jgi:glucose-1-phosphate thymidylyltransferase
MRASRAAIEHSIVFAGAEVLHVGARLESSLVGRGARVARDFSLPRALRVQLGDGATVVLH